MRNVLKLLTPVLLVVAMGAQAGKSIDKIASMSCGYQGPGLVGSNKADYKAAFEKAKMQCMRVHNVEAAKKYDEQARNCGNEGNECGAHFKALQQNWCGFKSGPKVAATDYVAMGKAIQSVSDTGICKNLTNPAGDTLISNYYGAQTNAADHGTTKIARREACFGDGYSGAPVFSIPLCVTTYNELFKSSSPY